jgi:hypothetical protein
LEWNLLGFHSGVEQVTIGSCYFSSLEAFEKKGQMGSDLTKADGRAK